MGPLRSVLLSSELASGWGAVGWALGAFLCFLAFFDLTLEDADFVEVPADEGHQFVSGKYSSCN